MELLQSNFAEFAKYGVVGILALVLLYVILKDKANMRAELTALNLEVREIIRNNTEAMTSLKDALSTRPCLKDKL